MPASVRVAGAHIDISANSGPYRAGITGAITANRQFVASMGTMGAATDRFRASVTSSLIATAAYAAGVGVANRVLFGTTRAFLEYDRGLIAISKTTGLAGAELDRLGRSLVEIGTVGGGGLSALGILRQDLFDIAVAAGQAGLQTERGIIGLTRAAAALQLSSDLIGNDAVRAITRYLEVTGQSIDQADRIASAYTHIGNNIVGTESEIAEFSRRLAQETRGAAALSDQFIFGLSAAFVSSGARLESASTVIQRALSALNERLTDAEGFRALARAAGVAEESAEALRQRFIAGTATVQDQDEALRILLSSLARLPQVAEAGLPSRGSLLEAIFGESNVRIKANLGLLINQFDRLDYYVGLANEGLESGNAHFEEANRAAESYSSRLRAVGNALQDQGTSISALLVPALVEVAEQYRLIELIAAGAAVVVTSRFLGRSLPALASYSRGLAAATSNTYALRAANEAVAVSSARVADAQQRLNIARRSTLFGGGVAGGRAPRGPTNQARRALRAATREQRQAQASLLALQQKNLAAARAGTGAIRRFGASLVGFLGGPFGAAFTAITVAGTAFLLFGNRSDEAREKFENLIDEMDQLAGARRGAQSGLDDIGQRLKDAEEAAEELAQKLEAAQRRYDILRRTYDGPLGQQPIDDAFEDVLRLSDDQVRLATSTRALREAYGRLGDASKNAAQVASASFERLPASLEPARAAVASFTRNLAATDDQQLQRLSAQAEAARSAGIEGRIQLAQAERRIEIQRQQAQAETRLFVLRRQLADQTRRVQRAQEEFDRQPLGSKARDEAEKQLDTQRRTLRTTSDQVDQQREQVRLYGQLTPAAERIERIERARLNLELDRLRAYRPEAVIADVVAERNSIEDLIDAAKRRLQVEQALRQQQRDQAQADTPQEAEFSRRRYEILSEFLGAIEEARTRATRATRDLTQAQIELEAIELQLKTATLDGTEALLKRRNATLDNIESLRAEALEAEAAAGEIAAARTEIEGIADAYARLTEVNTSSPLKELANDAINLQGVFEDVEHDVQKLKDVLDSLAARSLGRLEDALVNTFETGTLSVEDLANAIATDLIRALIRTVITANLAQVALAGIGAIFPGFTAAGGASAGTAPVRHSGGRAGDTSGLFRALRSGLLRDEVLAVLKRREVVVPEDLLGRSALEIGTWVKSLRRYHEGGVVGGTPGQLGTASGMPVQVNVINQGGQELDVVNSSARVTGEGLVVDVFVTDFRKRGPLYRMIQQVR